MRKLATVVSQATESTCFLYYFLRFGNWGT